MMGSTEMLPTVPLTSSGPTTTVVGFGCADLFRIPSSTKRQRLLGAAYDAGIRHFDVAPMYGLGVAEREVGAFARRHRDSVVIATKFGIAPTGAGRALGHVQAPIRMLFAELPTLRDRVRSQAAGPASGRFGQMLYSAVGYTRASAQASLENSLRELGTDHIDLFLLHDPMPHSVLAEELHDYLESERTAGRIRTWGIAGEPEPSWGVQKAFSRPVPVMQIRDDVFLRSLRRRSMADDSVGMITFGVFGRALPRLVAHIISDQERSRRWSEIVGADCTDRETIASFLLRDALRENRSGSVLISTVHPWRLWAAAELATDLREIDPALDRFLRLVRDELPSPSVSAE
jgi:D-threo-aldose 1-dehydrogenase